MKKCWYRLVTSVLLLFFVLSVTSCQSEMESYYTNKDNYVTITGTLTHIKYSEEGDALYLGFSDLNPRCEDTTFKIVGENLKVVQENGIDEKLHLEDTITFVSAPACFGDGYVMPIVSLMVNGEELLALDTGYENFLKWLD